MNVIEEVGKYHDYAVSMRQEFISIRSCRLEGGGDSRTDPGWNFAGMGIPYEEVAGTSTIYPP